FWHSAIYDPVRDRMVVFGGESEPPTDYNDVWALTLSGDPAWIELHPTGTPPSARHRHSAIYDPVQDRMLVFGGNYWNGPWLNDVWALALAGTPSWSAVSPTGTLPTPNDGYAAIYD